MSLKRHIKNVTKKHEKKTCAGVFGAYNIGVIRNCGASDPAFGAR